MELWSVNSERDEQRGLGRKTWRRQGQGHHVRRLSPPLTCDLGATSLRHDKKQGKAHLLEDCEGDEIN